VIRFIQRRVAAATGVRASVGIVLIVGAAAWRLGALLTEDAELLYESVLDPYMLLGATVGYRTWAKLRLPLALRLLNRV
jgi:hypothetical protein